jgi:hypothetical protein
MTKDIDEALEREYTRLLNRITPPKPPKEPPMNTPLSAIIVPRGTPVRITNGTARPPDRFKNKLSQWQSHNYLAVVVGPCDYSPDAVQLRAITRPSMCGVVTITTYARKDRLRLLDQPLMPVNRGEIEREAFKHWCADNYEDSENLRGASFALWSQQPVASWAAPLEADHVQA